MSEFSDMLERVKLSSIIGYLMYGTENSVVEDKGTYEERIENAYDKIFETLENMFPSANKENKNYLVQLWIFQSRIMKFI